MRVIHPLTETKILYSWLHKSWFPFSTGIQREFIKSYYFVFIVTFIFISLSKTSTLISDFTMVNLLAHCSQTLRTYYQNVEKIFRLHTILLYKNFPPPLRWISLLSFGTGWILLKRTATILGLKHVYEYESSSRRYNGAGRAVGIKDDFGSGVRYDSRSVNKLNRMVSMWRLTEPLSDFYRGAVHSRSRMDVKRLRKHWVTLRRLRGSPNTLSKSQLRDRGVLPYTEDSCPNLILNSSVKSVKRKSRMSRTLAFIWPKARRQHDCRDESGLTRTGKGPVCGGVTWTDLRRHGWPREWGWGS